MIAMLGSSLDLLSPLAPPLASLGTIPAAAFLPLAWGAMLLVVLLAAMRARAVRSGNDDHRVAGHVRGSAGGRARTLPRLARGEQCSAVVVTPRDPAEDRPAA